MCYNGFMTEEMKKNLSPKNGQTTLPTHPQKLVDHLTKVYSHARFFSDKKDFGLIHCYYHTSEMGYPIGMHSHAFYEINIITAGSGYHYIEKQCVKVNVGDVFVIPPSVEHGYYTNDSSFEIFHILLNCVFVERYKDELHTLPGYTILFETEPALRKTTKEKLFLTLDAEQFGKVKQEIEELWEFENSNYRGTEVQKIARTLSLISVFSQLIFISHQRLLDLPKHTESVAVVETLEYMRNHFFDKISVNKLAAIAHMSRSTYLRHFKALCKCTPSQYLTEIRIKQATELLQTSERSIIEISQDCGFFDSSHFLRIFSKFKGCSPSQYRKMQN